MKPLILTEADFANLSLLRTYPALRRMLTGATVVSSDAVPAEIVTMNTQVVLADDTNGERQMVRVVYPKDADPARGLISVLEPLGTALLGASPGCIIESSFSGRLRCLRLEKLVFQPEHSLRAHLITCDPPGAGS
jgi:regulator of nucleoside diphosphate kinase